MVDEKVFPICNAVQRFIDTDKAPPGWLAMGATVAGAARQLSMALAGYRDLVFESKRPHETVAATLTKAAESAGSALMRARWDLIEAIMDARGLLAARRVER